MNLLRKIYTIFLRFEYFVSLSFFYSQCYLHIIARTKLFDLIYNLNNTFRPIKGNIYISDDDLSNLQGEIKIKNPRLKNPYYELKNLDNFPTFLNEIIKIHRLSISDYLGKNFVFEKLTFSVTKSIPTKNWKKEFYSNFWHQDSDAYKLLKIFILINEVTTEDGPLTYLTLEDTQKNWSKLKNRNSINCILKIKSEMKFTGNKGDYLILDTSRNLHRASIPSKNGKILTLTLYPKWSKVQDVPRYKWNETIISVNPNANI
jgi:hypothetical protein